MSELFKICGGAVIAAVCAFFLKESSKTAAVSAAALGLTVLMGTVVGRLLTVLSPLKQLFGTNGANEYMTVMLKGLGIGMTVRITSDICKDMGENGLSGCIELAGKAEILILCFPILAKIVTSVRELLL